MATTTTDRNACSSSIWIDDGTGTLVDVSGNSNSFDYTFTIEIGDWQAFQDSWRQRLACGRDGAFTLNAVYTTTATEAYQILNAWFFSAAYLTPRTLSWYVPTKNVGSNYYTTCVLMPSFTVTLDPTDAGPVIATIELVPDGEISHSIVAT